MHLKIFKKKKKDRFYLFIYFRGGADGERESQADSPLSVDPDVAQSQDPEIKTRAKTKSQMLNLLSHPGAPSFITLTSLLQQYFCAVLCCVRNWKEFSVAKCCL